MTAFDTAALSYPSMVGYWKLKEASGNWLDSSGHGLTAQAVGTIPHAQPSIMPNDSDGCVLLDGTTRIFVNDDPLLRLVGSGTLIGWCQPSNVIDTHLMHKGFDYGIAATGSTFSGFGGATQNQVKVGLNTYMVASTASGTAVASTGNLYVNGARMATGATTLNSTGSNPLEIGSFAGGQLFTGYLQKFLIYSAALTDTQIQALYIAGALSALEVPLQIFQAMSFSRVMIPPGTVNKVRIANLSDTTCFITRGPVATTSGWPVFAQDVETFENVALTGLSVIHGALMGGKTLRIDAS